LGDYRLAALLARGGQAEVWRVRNPYGVEVALKVLPASRAAEPAARARLSREAQLLARLQRAPVVYPVEAPLEDENGDSVIPDFADFLQWEDPAVLHAGGRGLPAGRYIVLGVDPDWKNGVQTIRLLRDRFNDFSVSKGKLDPAGWQTFATSATRFLVQEIIVPAGAEYVWPWAKVSVETGEHTLTVSCDLYHAATLVLFRSIPSISVQGPGGRSYTEEWVPGRPVYLGDTPVNDDMRRLRRRKEVPRGRSHLHPVRAPRAAAPRRGHLGRRCAREAHHREGR
jgi:hypothetical protein